MGSEEKSSSERANVWKQVAFVFLFSYAFVQIGLSGFVQVPPEQAVALLDGKDHTQQNQYPPIVTLLANLFLVTTSVFALGLASSILAFGQDHLASETGKLCSRIVTFCFVFASLFYWVSLSIAQPIYENAKSYKAPYYPGGSWNMSETNAAFSFAHLFELVILLGIPLSFLAINLFQLSAGQSSKLPPGPCFVAGLGLVMVGVGRVLVGSLVEDVHVHQHEDFPSDFFFYGTELITWGSLTIVSGGLYFFFGLSIIAAPIIPTLAPVYTALGSILVVWVVTGDVMTQYGMNTIGVDNVAIWSVYTYGWSVLTVIASVVIAQSCASDE